MQAFLRLCAVTRGVPGRHDRTAILLQRAFTQRLAMHHGVSVSTLGCGRAGGYHHLSPLPHRRTATSDTAALRLVLCFGQDDTHHRVCIF